MIQKPRQLLQEARESDHAVCIFRVSSKQEVTGVLQVGPGGPVAVSVTGEVFSANPQIFSGAADIAKKYETDAMLVLEQPIDEIQALSAQEFGVQAFFLTPDQFELLPLLQRRGVWVGALLPETTLRDAKRSAAVKMDAIVCTPSRTKGAFTGQEYILFERLESLMHAIPQLLVCLQDISHVADEHLQKVSDTTVAALIFNKPTSSEMSQEAMKEFVVNKRAVSQIEVLLS